MGRSRRTGRIYRYGTDLFLSSSGIQSGLNLSAAPKKRDSNAPSTGRPYFSLKCADGDYLEKRLSPAAIPKRAEDTPSIAHRSDYLEDDKIQLGPYFFLIDFRSLGCLPIATKLPPLIPPRSPCIVLERCIFCPIAARPFYHGERRTTLTRGPRSARIFYCVSSWIRSSYLLPCVWRPCVISALLRPPARLMAEWANASSNAH